MPKRFLTDDAKTALTDAVKAIEARSSAEIVIAVRARSGAYPLGPAVVGIGLAFAALAFVLYSDFAFPLWAVLLDPFIVALIGGVASYHLPVVQRALMVSSVRDEYVRRSAHATFFEKGVRHTRDRVGVLVYVSLLEKRLELVGDSGVEEAVGPVAWKDAGAALDKVVRAGGDGLALATALEKLGDLLASALPRLDDDENELPDEVCG